LRLGWRDRLGSGLTPFLRWLREGEEKLRRCRR
jgi:hypothetical protein